MCGRKIVDELVEECSKNIDENEMVYNETLDEIPLNDYIKVCGSCTIYIVLFAVFLTTSVIINSVFICFHWYLKESNDQLYLKKDNVRIKFNPSIQTTIY